jgi:hypothetical protein
MVINAPLEAEMKLASSSHPVNRFISDWRSAIQLRFLSVDFVTPLWWILRG